MLSLTAMYDWEAVLGASDASAIVDAAIYRDRGRDPHWHGRGNPCGTYGRSPGH